MAGTAKNYNGNQIVLGPSDLWLDVAVPNAASRLTLDADGTPDNTANPTAIHLGMTAAGVTFEYMPEIQDFTSDELTAPHMSRIISEKASLKGEFLQVFNWNLLAKMTVGGTRNVNTNTSTGYEELTMGGVSTVSTFSVALIGPDIQGTGQYWVVQLYKTFNKSGFTFAVTRKDQSRAPFEFSGLAVTTRAIGDQIANFWHQGAANS
jgi:hypothetical protein